MHRKPIFNKISKAYVVYVFRLSCNFVGGFPILKLTPMAFLCNGNLVYAKRYATAKRRLVGPANTCQTDSSSI